MTTQEMQKALEGKFNVEFSSTSVYLNGMRYVPAEDKFRRVVYADGADSYEWCRAGTLLGDRLNFFHKFVEALQKEGRIK